MSTHRYSLVREDMRGDGHVLFVTLAPLVDDDRLIGRCHTLAFNWGFDSMEIVNLSALVVDDADGLEGKVPIQASPEELTAWAMAMRAQPDLVVGAWGTNQHCGPWMKSLISARVSDLIGLLAEYELELSCFGTTDSGQPLHPEYVSLRNPQIEIWQPTLS